jgi:hypothetical protein
MGATNRGGGKRPKGKPDEISLGERFARAPLLFPLRFHRDWQAACRSLLFDCSSLHSCEVLSRRHGYRIGGLASVWFASFPVPLAPRFHEFRGRQWGVSRQLIWFRVNLSPTDFHLFSVHNCSSLALLDVRRQQIAAAAAAAVQSILRTPFQKKDAIFGRFRLSGQKSRQGALKTCNASGEVWFS